MLRRIASSAKARLRGAGDASSGALRRTLHRHDAQLHDLTTRVGELADHQRHQTMLLEQVNHLLVHGGVGVPAAGNGVADASGAPDVFFHGILHELRTQALESVPKGARRALSVGASGSWYFDWFERSVNALDEHIGVEAFEPMPADLPANVTWLARTADRMEGVADGSVDLVFAGQTTEHLWVHELVGFLSEANRVLHDGGLLVLDSPNRLVTEHLLWSHGGHTVELSTAEITELVSLAGFDVETVRGLWRCRLGGQVLALEEGIRDGATLVRRVGGGPVDDCFVWWVEARRTRTADVEALTARTAARYAEHWPARVSRGLVPGSATGVVAAPPGHQGTIGSTLPFPLHAGRWRIALHAAPDTAGTDLARLGVRLVLPGDHLVWEGTPAAATVTGDTVAWELALPELIFTLALQIVAASPLEAGVTLRVPVEVGPV